MRIVAILVSCHHFKEFNTFYTCFCITNLQERLDLGPLLDLLLGHLLGDLPWVPVNASHQGMADKKEHLKWNHVQENNQVKDTKSENQDDFMFMRIFAMFEIVITLQNQIWA